MDTAIAIHSGFWGRTWGAVGRALGLTKPVPQATTLPVDAAFSGVPYVQATYSPVHALSSMRANPWVLACLQAIISDLTRCPIQAYPKNAKTMDERGRRIKPTPIPQRILTGASWRRTRRQIVADRILTGRWALLILRQGDPLKGTPIGLERLHPEHLAPKPGPGGEIIAWVYNASGSEIEYRPEQICTDQDISWPTGPEGLNPQSVVECLEADILADAAIAKHARISADKGRPDALVSPRSDTEKWGVAQVERLKTMWADVFGPNRSGGVAVAGDGSKLEVLGWAPKDMEGRSQREWTRQSIMAVLQVPPARLSLDSENRATQDDQMVTYWVGRIQALAMEFDDALNDSIGDALAVRLETDFSSVPYLQSGKTGQLERIEKHVGLGMSVSAAYAYEGLDDVDASWFAAPAQDPAPAAPNALPADDLEDEGDVSTEDLKGALSELRVALEEGETTDALSLLTDVEDMIDGLADAP